MLSCGCSYICFTSTSQLIGWEDRFFAPVKRLSGKFISRMTYNVSSELLNPVVLTYQVASPCIRPWNEICCVWLHLFIKIMSMICSTKMLCPQNLFLENRKDTKVVCFIIWTYDVWAFDTGT